MTDCRTVKDQYGTTKIVCSRGGGERCRLCLRVLRGPVQDHVCNECRSGLTAEQWDWLRRQPKPSYVSEQEAAEIDLATGKDHL